MRAGEATRQQGEQAASCFQPPSCRLEALVASCERLAQPELNPFRRTEWSVDKLVLAQDPEEYTRHNGLRHGYSLITDVHTSKV